MGAEDRHMQGLSILYRIGSQAYLTPSIIPTAVADICCHCNLCFPQQTQSHIIESLKVVMQILPDTESTGR